MLEGIVVDPNHDHVRPILQGRSQSLAQRLNSFQGVFEAAAAPWFGNFSPPALPLWAT
jgi:hypothetical protein